MKNSVPDFAISDNEALEAVREFARKCEEYSASSLSSAHVGTPREKLFKATTFEDHQAVIDDPYYQAAIIKEGTPPDVLPGWEENLIEEARFNLAYQRGVRLQELRACARARVRARTRHYRAQTRVRARRSPASTRRATADSGGSDGDGGGDPEPPRPGFDPSPICGGITPRMGGAL